jgi:hypothetical protein
MENLDGSMTLDRQSADALHDFISQGLVLIAPFIRSSGEVGLIALADDKGNLSTVEKFGLTRVGFIGAKEADWQDGGACFGKE